MLFPVFCDEVTCFRYFYLTRYLLRVNGRSRLNILIYLSKGNRRFLIFEQRPLLLNESVVLRVEDANGLIVRLCLNA